MSDSSLLLHVFINSEPIKRLKDRRDMSKFKGFVNGMRKRVMNLLKSVNLRVCKVVVTELESAEERVQRKASGTSQKEAHDDQELFPHLHVSRVSST